MKKSDLFNILVIESNVGMTNYNWPDSIGN